MAWNEIQGMWMTVNLLVSKECRKTHRDISDELEEWLESVATSAQSDAKEKDEINRILCGTPTITGVPELPKENKKRKKKKNVFWLRTSLNKS